MSIIRAKGVTDEMMRGVMGNITPSYRQWLAKQPRGHADLIVRIEKIPGFPPWISEHVVGNASAYWYFLAVMDRFMKYQPRTQGECGRLWVRIAQRMCYAGPKSPVEKWYGEAVYNRKHYTVEQELTGQAQYRDRNRTHCTFCGAAKHTLNDWKAGRPVFTRPECTTPKCAEYRQQMGDWWNRVGPEAEQAKQLRVTIRPREYDEDTPMLVGYLAFRCRLAAKTEAA